MESGVFGRCKAMFFGNERGIGRFSKLDLPQSGSTPHGSPSWGPGDMGMFPGIGH